MRELGSAAYREACNKTGLCKLHILDSWEIENYECRDCADAIMANGEWLCHSEVSETYEPLARFCPHENCIYWEDENDREETLCEEPETLHYMWETFLRRR